jgi:phage shock protein C
MNEPRKLYRTEGPAAMVAGVCGGIAEYFNIDPTIVRVLWVILTFAGTVGFWLYLVLAIIVPKKSNVYPGY